MQLTLYLRNARPSFAPRPEADVATIAVPDGSAVLTTWGVASLFVPTEPRIRRAWSAREVWLAARLGERGFGVMSGPHSPDQIRHLGDRERRRRELSVAVSHFRRQGMSQRAIAERLGLSQANVSRIERTLAQA